MSSKPSLIPGEQLSDIEEKARRYSELKDLLDEKEMRWLELSEKA